MKKYHLILATLLIQSASAWEGMDLTFDSDINCNYYKKSSTKDSENMGYQKCTIYKGIFDKYRPFVEHYNEKNSAGLKYTMQFHDVYAEYQFKKYIFDNLKFNKEITPQSLTYNKYKWEQDALGKVYNHIKIYRPAIMPKYRTEVRKWFEEGEGRNLSNEALSQTHKLRQRNVQEGVFMKYQFRMNTSYTSLLEIERELSKRNVPFEKINFQNGF